MGRLDGACYAFDVVRLAVVAVNTRALMGDDPLVGTRRSRLQ
jgi:hypothetical protein